MTQAERFEEAARPKATTLQEAVREFFEVLDRVEVSGSGRAHRPTTIGSCRVLDTARLNLLLPMMREMVGLPPNPKKLSDYED